MSLLLFHFNKYKFNFNAYVVLQYTKVSELKQASVV